MVAFARHRPRRGFTLVELLTVMLILGVLVVLVVGAARGILQHAARIETEQTLRAIEAGLSKYYDDWHTFPWYEDLNHPLMGKVAEEYRPLGAADLAANKGDPAAACLYASLGGEERRGPYYTGSGGNVTLMSYQDSQHYKVFVDGWGRPIHYFPPQPDPDAQNVAGIHEDDVEYYMPGPLLMSEGPEKDMPGVDDTQEDNIYNYPVDDHPPFSRYYQ